MRLGQKAMEALRAEVAGSLKAGDELVVIGEVGLRGTVLLAEREYETLRSFFSEGFLQDAIRLERTCGMQRSFEEGKATALYGMQEGGVLSALWKMAEASQVGLEADLRKIPIRQETIEICERFDLNPYKLLSGGSVLVGIPSGESLVQEYRRAGIAAAVIGQANKGNDRLLYSGEHARYLERPGEDELTKMPWGKEALKESGAEDRR